MDPGEGCQTSPPLPYPTSPPLVLPPTFGPMSMIWDAPLTAAVAKELNDRLGGARLRGHSFHWDNRELVLFFRSQTLRWALHPRAGWVTLHPPMEPPEGSRPLSADLVRVEARSDERLLRFLFRKVRGRSQSIQVIVELMTNQWNALLMEGQEEWIRHLLWTRRSESRTLAVGHAYEAPAPPGRRGLERALTEEEWKGLIRSPDEEGARGAVLRTVAFSSPLNLPALLNEETEGKAPDGGEEGGYRLWLRLRSLDFLQPCLLETDRGHQPYPVVLKGFTHQDFPSILEAVKAVSEERSESHGSSERVVERLDRVLQKAQGRVRAIEREMTQATDPGECRERANLLLARLGEVRKGEAHATLKGFDGQEVILSLDPSLSPQENAEALYQEAARQERALSRLPPLLRKAEARVDELRLLEGRLLAGELSPEEAETQLPAVPGRMKGQGTEEDLRLPYRRFRSSGGVEIRVGRGSGDNDALTFQHARPDDVWLHAREASGAHVVLRWAKKEPPPARDLAEAAVLAALNSRARNAKVVPVDWTRKKYVRKPRKAPSGTVIPDRAQTLFVQPDPALPDRLIWED
jgi:predicted ribosome quality control (RQC) complex YloA/Tae2 family protein